ncbi:MULTISPECIES: GspH/FimT family pseudopilin [unclassified Pseudoalteromonas]|uniref:GspH/FimT family pseudopilin n=1 Tax=unclassified Pseudoalteromonas TaxID=194690 RepID=UPI0023582780|nr:MULTISPECIES: GspH/FimT family pseudopilin [unclassified Pseudoalteromonas]MDC9564851.1 GspH/FimT family pseudopilin [Pseudoalteromonas sp. GAB2316C]MDC9569277.1 GspH/FimT family pseudopilin [Pseudoalteromonas sp. GABNB9D]MDC9573375.1 GspH/FimT family pseudopilin [Pseudoalteromonas sp. GABNS16A]MDC9577656.1 GspH/FimT family pseudopilin [Pseudoalteromonas sp. GABNS16E]MDC9585309.1 GspH/FimT family pseudopilin [Pseudoalteromonas sp. GABNS16C]
MKKFQTGLTLLELMVAVAIVGIIASIALWDSSDMLEENRAENFLLELKRNISFARSQAASTDEIVIVCPVLSTKPLSTSNHTCKSDWGSASTAILFIDTNDNDNYNSANDSLIRVMSSIPSNDKIKFTGDSYLRFDTSGRITTNLNDPKIDDLTGFIYCPNSNNKNNKALNVSVSGTAFYRGDIEETCD